MAISKHEAVEHMRRARAIARVMAARRPWCRDPEALYGAALLGLAEAIAHTDGDRSPPEFHRYSYLRMVGAVLDELRDQDVASRGERDAWYGNARATSRQAYTDRVSQEPQRRLVSLEQLMDRDDGNAWEPADPHDAAEVIELRDLWRHVEREFAQLKSRDRYVIRRSVLEDVPITRVGAELGIGQSAASLARRAALDRLATQATGRRVHR